MGGDDVIGVGPLERLDAAVPGPWSVPVTAGCDQTASLAPFLIVPAFCLTVASSLSHVVPARCPGPQGPDRGYRNSLSWLVSWLHMF